MRLLCLCVLSLYISFAAETPPSQRIDINNAPSSEIEKLPGIGPKLTTNLIAGRPYKNFDDLDRVKGIGPKLLEKMKPYVVILPMRGQPALVAPKPTEKPRINLNTASQKDLETLPGIGPKRAESIIQARPIKAPEDLLKIPGIKRAQLDELRPLIAIR
jgi:competence ComEA-like helix-hairpin-helix protein